MRHFFDTPGENPFPLQSTIQESSMVQVLGAASGLVPVDWVGIWESAVESNRSGVDECEGSLSRDV